MKVWHIYIHKKKPRLHFGNSFALTWTLFANSANVNKLDCLDLAILMLGLTTPRANQDSLDYKCPLGQLWLFWRHISPSPEWEMVLHHLNLCKQTQVLLVLWAVKLAALSLLLLHTNRQVCMEASRQVKCITNHSILTIPQKRKFLKVCLMWVTSRRRTLIERVTGGVLFSSSCLSGAVRQWELICVLPCVSSVWTLSVTHNKSQLWKIKSRNCD